MTSESLLLISIQFLTASLTTLSHSDSHHKHHALCLHCLPGSQGAATLSSCGKCLLCHTKRDISPVSLCWMHAGKEDWWRRLIKCCVSVLICYKNLRSGCCWWEIAPKRSGHIPQVCCWGWIITFLSLSVHYSGQAGVSIQRLHRPAAQFSLPAHRAGSHQQSGGECEYSAAETLICSVAKLTQRLTFGQK